MDVSRRRAGVKTSVVAGSIWETRMKVFNGDDPIPDPPKNRIQIGAGAGVSGKRKTWKSQSFDGNIQIGKKIEEQSKALSVSYSDGIKKNSAITGRRGGGRSDEKISFQSNKGRSDCSIEKKKKNTIQTTKSRSDIKLKLDSVDSDNKDIEIDKSTNPDGEIEKNPPQIEENRSEEDSCKEFGVCQEQISSPTEELQQEEEENEEEEEEAAEEEEEEEEIAIEVVKKSIVDIVEIKVAEEEEEENKATKVENSQPLHKPNQKEEENNVYHRLRNRTAVPTSSTFKQSPPLMRRAEIYQNLSKPTKPTSSVPLTNEYQNFQERHGKLQNLVDLVMWRDISRSAFVFGIGTFIIISSSYTKDLNVSFISVISYLGLVYLAAIFLYRSLICRGVIDTNDRSYVLGEEEAIWLLKLFLPYLNESLLKIKALFSGDPSTTMKMSVLLFVFARCGSSITIWKMAKLGFFGAFIVPKVCSSYSQQLTGYAKFWIRRFRDAWDSCTHKKAVALAIFSLVWNLSSMVARVWAVFMMFVAVRYYQQSMESDDWEEVEAEDEDAGYNSDTRIGGQSQRQGFGDGPRSTPLEINKVKKGS